MTFSWVTKGSSVSFICPLGKRDALQSTVYQNTKEWGSFLTFRWHSTLARLSQILFASWQWTVPRGYFASLKGFIRPRGWRVVLKETTLYTCPREKNFSRITTMDHVHLELEMCKLGWAERGLEIKDQTSHLCWWVESGHSRQKEVQVHWKDLSLSNKINGIDVVLILRRMWAQQGGGWGRLGVRFWMS